MNKWVILNEKFLEVFVLTVYSESWEILLETNHPSTLGYHTIKCIVLNRKSVDGTIIFHYKKPSFEVQGNIGDKL